jgi:predicted ATP-grasp superfamily ATP-dependent carboligase
VPPAQGNLTDFVTAINAATAEIGYDVVLPVSDAGALALSAERDRIDAIVPYAAHEVVTRAFDKLALAEAATRAGLGAPLTLPAQLGASLLRDNRPVVVKARLHAPARDATAPARMEVTIAPTAALAMQRAAQIRTAGGDPILQEVINGDLMAYSAVTDRDARVIAAVQQEAERVWPPGSGVSARARTVALDPELAEMVQRLLADLGWIGLMQLQFLVPSDGRPRLIDFNGRLYGSLALAVGAGVNLPALWAAAATGRAPAATAAAAIGVRYQWFEGDVRLAAGERGGRFVRGALSCLHSAVSSRHSVWCSRDPKPGLRLACDLLRRDGRRVSAIAWNRLRAR